MKKSKVLAKLLSAAVIFGGLYFGAVPAMAASTETESNNDKFSAMEIAVGEELIGTLSDDTDEDWYKITTDQNGYITLSVEMAKQDNYNTQKVYLYDSKLNELDSFELNSGDTVYGTSAKIGLPAGTTVYAMVDSTWGNPDGQKYSLVLNETPASDWEIEYNETADTATEMSVNTTYSGTLYQFADKDYYKVVTDKNGYVSVTAAVKQAVGFGHFDVHLYDADMNELDASDTLYTSENTTSYTSSCMGLPANTTLYVLVESTYLDPNGSEYTVKLNEKASSVWETEYNDTKATADSIALTKTYHGTLYKYDDVDYYKVSASVGTLDVSLRTNENNDQSKLGNGWDISILDKNLNVLKTTEGITTKNSVSATIKKAGTYYIKVTTNWTVAPPEDQIYDLRAMNVCQISYKKVAAPKINKSSFTVKWTKVTGAAGYQIRYSTYSSMKNKKTVTIKSGSTVSKKISGLKAKKKYYVQIRAYAKNANNKTIYGSWSGKKSVKTK